MIAALARIAIAAAGAVAGAAVARELDKPAQEREWHGDLGGVPYDFRPPTVEKLRRTLWDADNPRVLVPHGFGVGWSVNFARLAAIVQAESAVRPADSPVRPAELTGKPAGTDSPATDPPAAG